jgi:restriction endonuclease S subunit
MAVWSVASLQSVTDTRRIDADHYRPEYLRITALLSWAPPLKQFVQEIIHPAEFSRRYSDDGWKVVRTQNVRPLRMDFDSNEVFLSKKIANGLNKNHLRSGDILITRTGANFGQCSLFYAEEQPALATSHTFIVRANEKIESAYLALFLNTRQGRQLIDRGMYGSSQPEIAPRFLLRIPTPRFAESIEAELAMFVRKAYGLRKESISLYKQAQHLLESELGLDKLSFQKPVGYTARFSELEESHRSDAQHYQPRFTQLLNHLAGFSLNRIRDIRTCNRRGLQPVYVENGPIDVVNSQHIGPQHIDYDGLQKTSEAAFAASAEGHIQNNDLLIYTTGAYIGRTNVYLSNAPALASNHVNILRLNSDIDAAYMALVFQSIVGQFQTQKHARGSAQAELYPADIDRFVVPLLNSTKQIAIGDLIRNSLEKQQESKRLLYQAKTRVEQLIEEAVRS